MQYKDYYKILGVSRDSKPDDIRKAYRKLAKQYHPDINKDPGAEDKYKEINEAYEVLKDPEKRQKYDTLGMNWQAGQDFTPPPGWQHVEFNQGSAGDFSDFFNTLFGGGGGFQDIFSGFTGKTRFHQPMPRDIETDLTLSLDDVIRGGTHNLKFNNRTLSVRLPKGITEGSQIKLPGKNDGGGDIYVNIHIKQDKNFEISGHDLTREIKVETWDAVLGRDISVETLTGNVTVKMPPGIQDGQKLRLRGKGLPKRDGTNGDMYVKIKINIPRHLDSKQKELWQELAKLSYNH